MKVELHAKSDVGRVRRGNEDNFLVLELSRQRHGLDLTALPRLRS